MDSNCLEWLRFLALCLAGGFAFWKYREEMNWRRQRFASELWAAFSIKDHNKKAMIMLDWIRPIELTIATQKEPILERVTTDDLIQALQIHAHEMRFTAKHAAIRDIFDAFLADLAEIEHHIDRGLISFEQVKPYLLYWLKAMTGKDHKQHQGLPEQLGEFLDFYGYEAIKSLCKRADLTFPLRGSGPS